MSTSAETTEAVTTADRVADAVRHVAHASHRARLFQSMAEDAIETGVHAARRSFRRRLREIEDLPAQVEEITVFALLGTLVVIVRVFSRCGLFPPLVRMSPPSGPSFGHPDVGRVVALARLWRVTP